ncbi:hypothetical protein OEZ63_02425 [Klebsiella pneumoniae]|nr:hypothetical protein [Klebsiella pneumoniae]
MKMDSGNTGVKIKKVTFDWKEINKSEVSSCYRVTCKITTDNGIEVEGSYFYQWDKPGVSGLGSFNWDRTPEASAEVEAFNVAFGRVQNVLPMVIIPKNENWN